MRLALFIRQNMEAILVEWENFASTLLPAAAGLSAFALRDHAQHILDAVALDLETPQTPEEQADKSRGVASTRGDAPETAAQTHAILRAQGGFDIHQLVAEYRALRASVLRLWMDAGPLDQTGVEDIIRFNEAIDQAVAESVGHYQAQVERARNLFLGMLGHDMRSPLSTILTTASYLTALNAGEHVSVAASRLIRSGRSMQSLLDDLVDFNRTKLGLGIKVRLSEIDLANVVGDELEQLRGAHPNRDIRLETAGDNLGRWDRARLQQLLRNLVSNAIKYGAASAPVHVSLRGEENEVRLEVTNRGATIDRSSLGQIFDPLKRACAGESRESPEGLGLGLFIVREIVAAHGGEVEVLSEEEETTFVVHLPRSGPDAMDGASPG